MSSCATEHRLAHRSPALALLGHLCAAWRRGARRPATTDPPSSAPGWMARSSCWTSWCYLAGALANDDSLRDDKASRPSSATSAIGCSIRVLTSPEPLGSSSPECRAGLTSARRRAMTDVRKLSIFASSRAALVQACGDSAELSAATTTAKIRSRRAPRRCGARAELPAISLRCSASRSDRRPDLRRRCRKRGAPARGRRVGLGRAARPPRRSSARRRKIMHERGEVAGAGSDELR